MCDADAARDQQDGSVRVEGMDASCCCCCIEDQQDVPLMSVQGEIIGAPKGPSTRARTRNCPPGAARTDLIIFSVNPRRLWTRSDIVVVVVGVRDGFFFSQQLLGNGV